MSQWLAETSIALPSNKTAMKEDAIKQEREREIKERKLNKQSIGEVERYKKHLLKRILYRYYVFVGTIDSKVGMYTMNIKAKQNDRCLFSYRFRPKPVFPTQIDYLWKGEEEEVKTQPSLLMKYEQRQIPLSTEEREKKIS